MNLTYHSIQDKTHSAQPRQSAQINQSVTDLRYRGANYRRHQVAQTESLDAVLKYRGASSDSTAARALTMHHQRDIRNRLQTLLGRSAAEIGLTRAIANAAQDADLIGQAVFDRSAAALS